MEKSKDDNDEEMNEELSSVVQIGTWSISRTIRRFFFSKSFSLVIYIMSYKYKLKYMYIISSHTHHSFPFSLSSHMKYIDMSSCSKPTARNVTLSSVSKKVFRLSSYSTTTTTTNRCRSRLVNTRSGTIQERSYGECGVKERCESEGVLEEHGEGFEGSSDEIFG